MATINIYLELPDTDQDPTEVTPAFMHDLVKYQLQEFEMNGEIKSFEWEIV